MRRETHEQADVVAWLRTRRHLVFSVPNGAHVAGRTVSERARKVAKLKREGLLPGAPDLVVARAGGPPVAVEMKRAGQSRTTEAQNRVLAALECVGWGVVVGFGADDAIRKLERMGL